MKIAIMVCADSMYRVFRPLMDALAQRGHECRMYSHSPITLTDTQHGLEFMRWDAFNFTSLHSWGADRVIIFNGRFPWLTPAAKALQGKFKAFLCEIAWFTQQNNLYFAKDGIAEQSYLARAMPYNGDEHTAYQEVWKNLQAMYKPSVPQGIDLSTPYVIVPLQMERDTSIIYGSPYFRTMQSFIDWCAATAKDKRLIFKTHPRCPEHNQLSFGRHQVLSGRGNNMNDLVAYSEAVVGINSTSLVEALVHGKPTVQLGVNVAMSDPTICEMWLHHGLADSVELLKTFSSRTPEVELRNKRDRACMLYLNQVSVASPPGWILDAIIKNEISPRYCHNV